MRTHAVARHVYTLFLVVLFPLVALVAGAPAATAQTQAAVEYYYPDWGYYFETSFPDEIAALDAGAFGGLWKRTGQTFQVWTGPTNGALPTCRFFSTIFAPKSSHFYTPYAAECASLKAGQGWQYEAIAFYLLLPDAAGNCPAGTKILYRLYNNGMGGAPNHRYTTSLFIFNLMKAAGWLFEGNGLTGAFACVPIFDAQGLWQGMANDGTTLYLIVLDDASYYVVYTLPGNHGFANGFVHGTMANPANGQFNSSDGRAFIFGSGVEPATLAGTYVTRASMNGTATTQGIGTSSFALTYQAIYEQPASIAVAAGTYSGGIGTASGAQNAVFSISSSGEVSGTFGNCTLTGSVSPRGSYNVLDLYIATGGNTCTFGGMIPHTGIAYYDAQNRTLFAAAPNPGRGNAILFIGTKQ